MLTINAKFKFNDEIKSLGVHVFEHQKDPYSSWLSGRDFLIKELNDLGFKFDRLVKVNLSYFLFIYQIFFFKLIDI